MLKNKKRQKILTFLYPKVTSKGTLPIFYNETKRHEKLVIIKKVLILLI
jgi:hypothetical protein